MPHPCTTSPRLRALTEFTGNPPVLPARLLGGDTGFPHDGGRGGFADLPTQLTGDYDRPVWGEAGALFEQSAQRLEELTDAVVEVILGESDTLEPTAEAVRRVADLGGKRLSTTGAPSKRLTPSYGE